MPEKLVQQESCSGL